MALSEAERRQQYLDKIPEEVIVLKEMMIQCLDDYPDERPPIQQISEMIESLKVCSVDISKGFSKLIMTSPFKDNFWSQQMYYYVYAFKVAKPSIIGKVFIVKPALRWPKTSIQLVS